MMKSISQLLLSILNLLQVVFMKPVLVEIRSTAIVINLTL